MRIISLNASFGQNLERLLDFITQEAADTDVFCFQEVFFGGIPQFSKETQVRLNLYSEISPKLPGFKGIEFLAPAYAKYYRFELLPEDAHPGLAIFVKQGFKVLDTGGFPTYRNIPTGMNFGALLTGNCQWVRLIDDQGEELTIMHIHGIYQRDTDKADTPERQEQSRILLDFIKNCGTKVVLLGDFNLLPNTKSIEILGESLLNLIRKYGITDTRGRRYAGPIRFADYCFISKEIKERTFRAIDSEASDHLPLELEYYV